MPVKLEKVEIVTQLADFLTFVTRVKKSCQFFCPVQHRRKFAFIGFFKKRPGLEAPRQVDIGLPLCTIAVAHMANMQTWLRHCGKTSTNE